MSSNLHLIVANIRLLIICPGEQGTVKSTSMVSYVTRNVTDTPVMAAKTSTLVYVVMKCCNTVINKLHQFNYSHVFLLA